jgi:hypothetical protein
LLIRQLLSGDFQGALTTIEAALVGGIAAVGAPILDAFITVRQRIAARDSALAAAVSAALIGVGTGFFRAVDGVLRASIEGGQEIVDAVLSLDLGNIVTAIVSATAGFLGSFVTGGQAIVDRIVFAQQTIAAALAQPPAPLAEAGTELASRSVAEPPTLDDNTVNTMMLSTMMLSTMSVDEHDSTESTSKTGSTAIDAEEKQAADEEAADGQEESTADQANVVDADDAQADDGSDVDADLGSVTNRCRFTGPSGEPRTRCARHSRWRRDVAERDGRRGLTSQPGSIPHRIGSLFGRSDEQRGAAWLIGYGLPSGVSTRGCAPSRDADEQRLGFVPRGLLPSAVRCDLTGFSTPAASLRERQESCSGPPQRLFEVGILGDDPHRPTDQLRR